MQNVIPNEAIESVEKKPIMSKRQKKLLSEDLVSSWGEATWLQYH